MQKGVPNTSFLVVFKRISRAGWLAMSCCQISSLDVTLCWEAKPATEPWNLNSGDDDMVKGCKTNRTQLHRKATPVTQTQWQLAIFSYYVSMRVGAQYVNINCPKIGLVNILASLSLSVIPSHMFTRVTGLCPATMSNIWIIRVWHLYLTLNEAKSCETPLLFLHVLLPLNSVLHKFLPALASRCSKHAW